MDSSYIETFKALGFSKLRILGVLDGRSCLLCACLDGKTISFEQAKNLAPMHEGCRCSFVGTDDSNISGFRPFVMHKNAVKDIPKKERRGKIGQVPAGTTFAEWFTTCTPDFQKDYLGEFRYNLYANHNYKLHDFVDLVKHKVLDEIEIKKAP